MRLISILILFIPVVVFSQLSIHQEESRKYADYGELSQEEYDELNGFVRLADQNGSRSELQKIVFGYHPYWGGSNYLNYQWDLLSDLSYFSYEVDPETGNAVTYHDWYTSPAIDSAFANGTRVHLCVTLFSGQGIFFNNPESRQTLTNNLISMVKQRGAHGVSLDFEAVPASQGENMIDYIAEFATAFRDSIPDGILSIAMPAVDWSGIFDVSELNQYIDLYMIMGYDYYWNGSTMAGPVDPHYSMTGGYNYSVSRTVSYYQSEGMPMDKMLLGVPYYAREWATASQYAPSATTGYGSAYTWANIMNNSSGNYSAANKHVEPNSFSPYYSYYGNGWNQCFVNDTESLSRRYKMVNQRGMAGIGIWALGYDNGHTELWDLIGENFASGTQITIYDILFDSGGPAWDYYDDEDYVITFHAAETDIFELNFWEFDLESGFDSLWVYNGEYPGGELLGGYSGNDLPPNMNSMNVMSIRFKSDHATKKAGWVASIYSFPVGVHEISQDYDISIYPNPVGTFLNIESSVIGEITIYDLAGNVVLRTLKNEMVLQIDLSDLPVGVYMLSLTNSNQQIQRKIIKF